MAKNKKTLSAGVIVSDGTHVILGHITNGNDWDLPKGRVDVGESMLQAAVRELEEETGLHAPPEQLIPLGVHTYTNAKDLMIYVWPQTQMPDPHTLICTSLFTDTTGKQIPELDDFVSVDWQHLESYTRQHMTHVLRSVEAQAKELIKNHAKS